MDCETINQRSVAGADAQDGFDGMILVVRRCAGCDSVLRALLDDGALRGTMQVHVMEN